MLNRFDIYLEKKAEHSHTVRMLDAFLPGKALTVVHDVHLNVRKIRVASLAYKSAFCSQRRQQRPCSTIECSQAAAWTTNRSLLVASRVKAFPASPTNSGWTQPRAVHLDGGAIGCNQCVHLALGKCSGLSRHATNPLALSGMPISHHLHPCPHLTHHSHD